MVPVLVNPKRLRRRRNPPNCPLTSRFSICRSYNEHKPLSLLSGKCTFFSASFMQYPSARVSPIARDKLMASQSEKRYPMAGLGSSPLFPVPCDLGHGNGRRLPLDPILVFDKKGTRI